MEETITGALVETGTKAATGATDKLNETKDGAYYVSVWILLAFGAAALGAAAWFVGRWAGRGINNLFAWSGTFLVDVKERHFGTVDKLANAVDKQADGQVASVAMQKQMVDTLETMRRECVEGHERSHQEAKVSQEMAKATHSLVAELITQLKSREGTA